MSKNPMLGLLAQLKNLQFEATISRELSRPISLPMFQQNEKAKELVAKLNPAKLRGFIVLAVEEIDDPKGEPTVKLHHTVIGDEATVDYLFFETMRKLDEVKAVDANTGSDGVMSHSSSETSTERFKFDEPKSAAADRDSEEHPVCEGCGKRHPNIASMLDKLFSVMGDD